MEKKFVFKNLPISPKKLRFLLPSLKKISPVRSLDYLFYIPKKGAKILRYAIKSAIDAVKSNSQIKESELKFKTIIVDEGRKLKRFRPGGRGTIKPIVHRYSHLTVIFTDQDKNFSKKEKESFSEKKREKNKKNIKNRD